MTTSRELIDSLSTSDASSYGMWISRFLRPLVLRRLNRISSGVLRIVDATQEYTFGSSSTSHLRASVYVEDPRFYGKVAFRGSLGAAEAYSMGYWRTDDLTGLVRLLARNREAMEDVETGLGRLTKPLDRVFHFMRANTRGGARKNIHEHYDLGNDFFSLFLDETMMYSCAYFEKGDESLSEASRIKIDRICRKLSLEAKDHVVEIGTGWGGFALHAAREYGCRVTTTTISEEQFEWTRRLIEREGLEDRITLLLRDYRDLDGSFDKLVSIEMIEAVGHRFLPDYFSACKALLRSGGRGLIQGITIAEEFFESSSQSVDFIKHYIFPGSELPSLNQMRDLMRSASLEILSTEDITAHYPPTLASWRRRFLANLEDVLSLGHSPEFARMWRFYFSYCEGGFLERHIEDHQICFAHAAP